MTIEWKNKRDNPQGIVMVTSAGVELNPAAPILAAGSALIGKVGIDQTTPGTTNKVVASVASGGVASGAIASGAVASGAVASGAIAAGAIAAGAKVAGAEIDGHSQTLGITTGAAVITDANGTIQQYLRGLVALWLAGLKACEAHIGEVGGKGLQITVTPTLTVGATYAANDFVGTDHTGMTFAGAGRIAAGSGRVIGAILHDYVIASVAAELWLFTVPPAGLGLDSAAFTITDNLTCIGVIPFNTYYASALNSISNGTIPNGQIPFKCAAADTALYGALVTRGAPAYTNGLVSVSIFVDQD